MKKITYLRKARGLYSQGLALEFDDGVLRSTLLTNRAAINLLLGNNRQVIEDCTTAVQHNKQAVKAYWRAACALMRLQKYAEAIEWCDRGLLEEPNNKSLIIERQKAVKAKVKSPFF